MSGLIAEAQWDGEEEPLALKVSSGGAYVLVLRPSLSAVVLDSQGQVLLTVPPRWGDWISGIWGIGKDYLLLGSSRGHVVEVTVPSGEVRSDQALGPSWVSSLAVGAENRIWAAGVGKALIFWSREKGLELNRWEGFPSTVTGLQWFPGGPLAACSYSGVRVFSTPENPSPRHLEWQGSALEVLWSPDRKYIATVEQDRTVHLWTYPGGLDMRMGVFQTKAQGTRWIRGGRYLVTTGDLDAVVWDCGGKGPEGRSPLLLEGHSLPVRGVAEWTRGVATLGEDGALVLWTGDWKREAKAKMESSGVFLEAQGKDRLVSAETTGRVTFWGINS